MDPLSVTASIVAVVQVTAEVIKYLNDVKDAPKERARLAIEASSLSNLLVSLRYQWEDGKSNEAWYEEVNSLGVQDGPLDQYQHALEKLQLKLRDGKGLAKLGNALVWKFSKEEVASILSRIERLKSLVQIALQMNHFKLSQEIRRCMDGIQSDNQAIRNDTGFVRSQMPVLQNSVFVLQDGVDKLQLGVDGFQQESDRQRHNVLMEWISSSNFPAQQSDLIGRRQAGTGQWFLNSPEFAKWLYRSNETLFCPGIPGAGKTMMAAIAIDQLSTTTESDAIIVAYIFCSYKSQADQTASSLLAAILKQLVQARPYVNEPVSRLYEQHRSQMTRPSMEEIFAVLQIVVKDLSRVYVVVDGLDECSDRDGNRRLLLAKLRDLQRTADVHLLVTSRYVLDIENEFKLVPTLEVRASDADVKRFVQGQIYRLPRCIQRDEELQGVVGDQIVDAVDGMFLLARLHVDSLRDKRTKAQVLSTLDKLSKGSKSLDEAYDEAIKRVEAQLPEDSKLAKKVLSWITYAQRPLTTRELCHALAVTLGDEDLNEDNILDVEDIVSVCAGLIVVDDESTIIRLVHYTTQEYFERIREDWNPTAQLEIASTCLTYLCFRPFRSGSCPNDEAFERRLEQNAFLDYASHYWGQHALTVQKQVHELASIFLQDINLASCAVQAMLISISGHNYRDYSQTFPRQTTDLHLTAWFGMTYLSRMLLLALGGVASISVDARDNDGQTPLSWAAMRGHDAVVKLLAERDDVEADAKDIYGWTPLLWAADRGHAAVVGLLVERDDVEADSKDQDGRTPLSLAAREGHEAIVKLLVERDDVEADAKDNDGQTPLLWASMRGHDGVVKLLVERDNVESDSRDKYGQTSLSWAAERGHQAVVELLVGKDDIDADSRDKYGHTPLSWAAERGHQAVVELLVGRDDIDADSRDNYGQTPLSLAASRGHAAVVKLLVERDDVEADSKDQDGWTPLSLAARRAHEAVVKLLLERDDVEADSKDTHGWTPLSLVAERGHDVLVKLLVERDDVDIDSKDNYGQTPLSLALEKGHEAIAKLLRSKLS